VADAAICRIGQAWVVDADGVIARYRLVDVAKSNRWGLRDATMVLVAQARPTLFRVG
jgi:hypothetical protein